MKTVDAKRRNIFERSRRWNMVTSIPPPQELDMPVGDNVPGQWDLRNHGGKVLSLFFLFCTACMHNIMNYTCYYNGLFAVVVFLSLREGLSWGNVRKEAFDSLHLFTAFRVWSVWAFSNHWTTKLLFPACCTKSERVLSLYPTKTARVQIVFAARAKALQAECAQSNWLFQLVWLVRSWPDERSHSHLSTFAFLHNHLWLQLQADPDMFKGIIFCLFLRQMKKEQNAEVISTAEESNSAATNAHFSN